MRQSPWKAYFGQMQKNSSKRNGGYRHPVVVSFSVVSVIGLVAAAISLRVNKWYFGKVPVGSLCNDTRYKASIVRPVIPIEEWVADLIAFLDPLVIVLFIEVIVLIVSLDKNDSEEGDGSKPRPLRGPYLFFFRFLHFVAVHLLTLAFVSVVVDLAKIAFDWHRPYFITKFPINCENNDPRRTISPEEIKARLGFPSHRVALLAAASVLLSVHAVRSLRALRSSGPFQALVVLESVLPLIFASASVLNSHENRPTDVIVGLLIGAIGAAFLSSMLPSEVNLNNDDTVTSRDAAPTPSTIEELNSVMPMRQAVTWQIPRSPIVRNSPGNRQPVPGYSTRG